MSTIKEIIQKFACEFSVDVLDKVNLTIDELKTKSEDLPNCVDRESYNLGLSGAMEIVNRFKKGIEERCEEDKT